MVGEFPNAQLNLCCCNFSFCRHREEFIPSTNAQPFLIVSALNNPHPFPLSLGHVLWKSDHSSALWHFFQLVHISLELLVLQMKPYWCEMVWTDFCVFCALLLLSALVSSLLCSCMILLTHAVLVNEITTWASILFMVFHMQKQSKLAFSITLANLMSHSLTQEFNASSLLWREVFKCCPSVRKRVFGSSTDPSVVVLNF